MSFMLLFVGTLIFLFAPFELYLANIDDFWFNIYDFGGYLLIAFVLYILICIMFGFLFRKHTLILGAVSYILFVLGLAFYIQGNYILFDYGELDGTSINWSLYNKEGFYSTLVFAIVLILGLVCFILIKNKKTLFRWANGVSICLILMFLVTLATLVLSKNGMDNKLGYVVTDRNETNYSVDDNIIVVVLDTYDARVFEDLYENGYRDELNEVFNGFTWYRNTISTYRLTDFSLPEILTGKCYLNETSYGDYIESSYLESELLRELNSRNYSINLYISTPIPQGEVSENVDNWNICKIKVSSHRRLLEHLYKLVCFRYMPQPVKRYFWTYTGEIDDLRIVEYDGERQINPVSWGNDNFRNSICSISRDMDNPKFSFIHLRGIHAPRLFDSKFNRVEEEVSLEESAKGMNLMLSEFFKKLKELGIYDDSTIIVMGDHGAYIYDYGYGQCPLFMVKYKCEKKNFTINEVPLSYDKMEKILITLLDKNISSCLDELSSDGDRYHYETEWSDTLKSNERSKEFVEYAITGHAFETDKIHETGKHY